MPRTEVIKPAFSLERDAVGPQLTPHITPPESPQTTPASLETLTEELFPKLLEFLTAHGVNVTPEASEPEENGKDTGSKKEVVRALKEEYVTLNEIFDKVAYKYKIAESNRSASKDDDEWTEYVFVVCLRFERDSTDHKAYMDIKSEELQDILRLILKGVTGVSLREDKPSVEPNLLFNYMPELNDHLAHCKTTNPDGSPQTRHLKLLLKYLSEHYTSTKASLGPLLKYWEITFDLLWALFRPNTLLYYACPCSDEPRCVILDWCEEKKTFKGVRYVQLDCHYLNYDEKTFGDVSISHIIEEFRGVKKINSIGVFPLEYHRQKEMIRDDLIRQGRKFISLIGVHHRCYQGNGFLMHDGKLHKTHVQGRVMIDADSFRQINPNYSNPKVKNTFVGDQGEFFSAYFGMREEVFGKRPETVGKTGLEPGQLGEDDLLLCSLTVLGFSFGDKLWLELSVAYIEEIKWDAVPFESLVLPDGQKTTLKVLVETQTSFDDVVHGKGKGLIFLLHGRPGLGKTLTAEGISELLHRPLYTVCAGDLGTNCEKLERQLPQVFDLAHHWNALLLLDEADVFLAERSDHNLQRNATVTIFLRHLEYFQGILFLTTNRVATFDEAILSRVHFALRYKELDARAKKEIWTTFLERANHGVDVLKIVFQDELEALVKKELNGRQIKNAVRTADALAKSKWEPLSYEHLQYALTVIENFEHDMKNIGRMENLYT